MGIEQHTGLTLADTALTAGLPETTVDSDLAPRAARLELNRLEPGDRIGRFSIQARIGQGGMGVVYLGHDDRLNRLAAIKLVQSDRAGPHGYARMLREARALARVSHPNVVQVYEVGEHGPDIYIAMEFVDGPTLREWLAGAPRDPIEIYDRFIAAAHGLAAAHDKGLIHRDFKPDNVMIGSDGRVRVMDFGLVTGSESSVEFDPQATDENYGRSLAWAEFAVPLTTTGACLGTPAYMAPEQFVGAAVDGRSDQFSFCVSLWEALYHQRPFAGQTPMDLAANIATGQLRSPPTETGVPAKIRALMDRGLSAEPEARWPSMHALVHALNDAVHELASPSPAFQTPIATLDPKRVRYAGLVGLMGLSVLAMASAVAAGRHAPASPAGEEAQAVTASPTGEEVHSGPDPSIVESYLSGLQSVEQQIAAGNPRQAALDLMAAVELVEGTEFDGASSCLLAGSTLDIADQMFETEHFIEARLAYAMSTSLAEECPYTSHYRLRAQQQQARSTAELAAMTPFPLQ